MAERSIDFVPEYGICQDLRLRASPRSQNTLRCRVGQKSGTMNPQGFNSGLYKPAITLRSTTHSASLFLSPDVLPLVVLSYYFVLLALVTISLILLSF
ncbi:hypothetical protein BDV18DRAFT_46287 [Aspergillus unguis]